MRSLAPLLLLALPGAAAADPRLELGGAIGGHAFASDVELGVDDRMDEPGPAGGAALGLRLGVQLHRRLALEGEAIAIATEDDVLGDEATVYGLRAHARFDLRTGRLRPFVVAGVGVHVLRATSAQMDDDTDQAYHWGGGVRYGLSPRLDLRVDLRHLLVPDRTLDGATSDVEVTAGVTYRFGGTRPRAIVAAAVPPPRPGDRDGDGVLDPEDACPTQPEDRDGFQDADGCIDPDNDGDGIVDAADRCPLVAETRNGWQDEDGCADEVIAELTGIGFETDSAKIDSGSTKYLDLAFRILSDHPQLSIEISGHTSAEGDPDHNLDLSLRRAQAVKAYLVRRGIAGARILTVGHGPDVPIADNATEEGRRKNRRIEFRVLRPDEVPH